MRRSLTPLMSGLLFAAPFAVPLAVPLAAQQVPDSAPTWQRQRIEALLGLPRRADELRRAGAPDSSVRSVLDVLIKQKVPAQEAATILEAERDAVREHGPTDNFGAFVQAQLAAGKRGRELSAAIRAEHEARGKGKKAKADRDHEMRGDERPKTPERGKRPGNPNAKRPS